MGYRLGSIYLFGYVSEMLLKAAYFRLRGWAVTQPIAMADLRAAKHRAVNIFGVQWGGNLHDLRGWTGLLIQERAVRIHPYPPVFRRRLWSRVKTISANWTEALRYHDMRPFRSELNASRTAANWLLASYRNL